MIDLKKSAYILVHQTYFWWWIYSKPQVRCYSSCITFLYPVIYELDYALLWLLTFIATEVMKIWRFLINLIMLLVEMRKLLPYFSLPAVFSVIVIIIKIKWDISWFGRILKRCNFCSMNFHHFSHIWFFLISYGNRFSFMKFNRNHAIRLIPTHYVL